MRSNTQAADGERRAVVARRAVFRFVSPILALLLVSLLAAVVSLELLSTIRAYVGGEGLYSKRQKAATYYLTKYSLSRSEADFQRYGAAIDVPLGDRRARLAMLQRPLDTRAAREGLLAGGNDPADVAEMVWLFVWLHDVGPMKRAVQLWTQGDAYTVRIAELAARLRSADNGRDRQDEAVAVRAELQDIDQKLTPLEDEFSATLGGVARLTRTALILALAIGTVLISLLSARVIHARLSEREAKERGLQRLAGLYAALSQTSQLVRRVADRQSLFEELCRICVNNTGLSLAAVGLWDEAGTRPAFVASHGAHHQALATLVLPDGSHEGADRISGGAQIFNGPDAVSALAPVFHSAASFPLRCRASVVGVLWVFAGEGGFFRADFVELMEQLAGEASFALENLQHEYERRHQAALLADQNRILNLVASGAELPLVLKTIAQFIESQCAGSICTLVALDQGGAQYEPGVESSLPEGFSQASGTMAPTVAAGPCAEAIRTRAPVRVNDLARYPVDEQLRAFVRMADLQTGDAWPILGDKHQVLGALALYHRRGRDSRPADANVVRICIDLAGIAIEHRRYADRIHHMAHHDELTGLPNRLLFNHFLRRALVRARAQKTPVAVMFLDLDRFKVINDTLGHKAGDEALCLVAERLVGCLTATDSLARVGGDEFTLVVERFRDPQELAEVAQKLLGAAARSLVIDGHECHLSGSIGVSIFPDDGKDNASLLKKADIAMYRAKAAGRNKFQFFSKEMNEHSVERLTLENELRHAVTQRQFAIHYQPKVNVATGRITGAEALVRWQHPQRGLLPPGAFIGIAEEIGLIGAIGSQVLEAACKDARRWSAQGTDPLPVAINLSAVQFDDPRLLDDLDCVLVQTGFDPFQLEVEITETAMMADPEKTMKLLEKIRERGIGVAIDDFGMGHSSLAYLKRFPADTLKIDRAFVRDIVESQNDLAIATAIIAMGHTMGMKVIAEGVETRGQLEILQRCGCDDFQGFLFSPAVTAAEFQRLLLADVERAPRSPAAVEPVVVDTSAGLGRSSARRGRRS